MGVYLNSKKPAAVYRKSVQSLYFIDKTEILNELMPIVELDLNEAEKLRIGEKDIRYLCITRPRRFGKTMTANMVASFFGKGKDTRQIFQNLKVRNAPGYEVHPNVCEYAATSMNLNTRDEIFSAMVVYGFLNYENGNISIPNKELMDKFADMVQKEPSLGNVNRLTRESGRMLRATKAGDTKTMTDILEFVHNTESPLNVYNDEAELASVIRWAYLQAIDSY